MGSDGCRTYASVPITVVRLGSAKLNIGFKIFALIQNNGLLRKSSSPPYIIINHVMLRIFIAICLFFECVPKYECPSFCGF